MRGRLAPSPTGDMHLGNARTALLAWLVARSRGGEIVMRVEDLDRARVVSGAEARILEDLRWLGLDWDGEVVRQSERFAIYAAKIDELIARDLAYECACSRKEIAEAASAPHGDEPVYPGTCRDLAKGEAAARAKSLGRGVAVRWRGGETIAFDDEVCGRVERPVDDFVIRRADGVAAYQLAVVVDDIAMRVDHVLRADDLLSSTPRQIALWRAFDATPPRFAHVPLVLAPTGERLAKRNRPATIRDLRERDITSAAIIAALATSAGLAPLPTPRAFLSEFNLATLRKDPVTIDL